MARRRYRFRWPSGTSIRPYSSNRFLAQEIPPGQNTGIWTNDGVTTYSGSESGSVAANNPWIIANGGHQTPSIWATVGGGSWSNSGNWMYGVPNADGAIAVISVSTSTALTVTLDKPVTLGALVLGSGTPGVGYSLSGSGGNTLTFSNIGNSTAAAVSAIDGAHAIDAPVVLASNLVVTSTSSNPWTLSFGTASSITDNGDHLSLTMSASNGTLILSGSGNYTGSTIVTAGTLIVTDPDAIQSGTSLTVGAEASSIFGALAAPAPTTVPEPGTLSLLGVGAVGLLVCGLRRRGTLGRNRD